MKEMTELKMVYELVISRANPLDNPRYELLNHAQRKMKDEILNVIRQTNPNYPEMDYDDDVFKYIVQFNDEYCIDAFAKGISFALNFKEQAERFMNKNMIIKKRNLLPIEVSSKIGFNNIAMIDIKFAYSGYKCVKFAEISSVRLVI